MIVAALDFVDSLLAPRTIAFAGTSDARRGGQVVVEPLSLASVFPPNANKQAMLLTIRVTVTENEATSEAATATEIEDIFNAVKYRTSNNGELYVTPDIRITWPAPDRARRDVYIDIQVRWFERT